MKAYLCSIGERTTDICAWQLQRLGFEVILLDDVEPWVDKYKKFIKMARRGKEGCLRIDADVIPNKNLRGAVVDIERENMVQFTVFDFYKNNISNSVVYYSEQCLKVIELNLDKIDEDRPETSAWRLKEINNNTSTSNMVVGMHGFFQDDETIKRARKNKINRGQINGYDFELVDRIIKL